MNYNKKNFVRSIEKGARVLVDKHLGKEWNVSVSYKEEKGYATDFSSAKQGIGNRLSSVDFAYCSPFERKIVINKYAVERYKSPSFWRKTILHEIGHGLADRHLKYLGKSHWHDNYWEKTVIKLGIEPDACLSNSDAYYMNRVDKRLKR